MRKTSILEHEPPAVLERVALRRKLPEPCGAGEPVCRRPRGFGSGAIRGAILLVSLSLTASSQEPPALKVALDQATRWSRSGRHAEVVALFSRPPFDHVRTPAVLKLLVEAHDRLGRYYERALSYDAAYLDTLENLRVLALHAKDRAAAVEWFDKVLPIDPDRRLSRTLKAQALEGLRRMKPGPGEER